MYSSLICAFHYRTNRNYLKKNFEKTKKNKKKQKTYKKNKKNKDLARSPEIRVVLETFFFGFLEFLLYQD